MRNHRFQRLFNEYAEQRHYRTDREQGALPWARLELPAERPRERRRRAGGAVLDTGRGPLTGDLSARRFLLRGATETAVNLRYLLQQGTPEVFEAFVRSSLRLDKRLHDRIQAKVAARGGMVLPMEHSMLAGIERAFKVAGVDLGDVDADDRSAWSKRGAFGRFEAVGLKDRYSPYFGVQRSYVHGNWHELYDHNLTVQPDGGFLPDLSFEEELQPQPLLAGVDVLADAAARYLGAAAPPSIHRETLEDRIGFCAEKAQLIARAWERFRQTVPGLSGA